MNSITYKQVINTLLQYDLFDHLSIQLLYNVIDDVELVARLLNYRAINGDYIDPTIGEDKFFMCLFIDEHTPINLKLLEILLNYVGPRGERVDPTVYNNYALREASFRGDVKAVVLLLSINMVNPLDNNSEAITNAIQNGHTEVVNLLVNYINSYEILRQIILTAIEFQQIEILKLLLKLNSNNKILHKLISKNYYVLIDLLENINLHSYRNTKKDEEIAKILQYTILDYKKINCINYYTRKRKFIMNKTDLDKVNRDIIISQLWAKENTTVKSINRCRIAINSPSLEKDEFIISIKRMDIGKQKSNSLQLPEDILKLLEEYY
uniref:Ankyrin repeat protein n=1 Tax=viral metagenome TaxID=1070528 RepID=A0A6C0D0X1_9ZZZZ